MKLKIFITLSGNTYVVRVALWALRNKVLGENMDGVTKSYINHLAHPLETWKLIKYQSMMAGRFEELLISGVYIWLTDRLKPDTTVLDIGANCADTAIFFSAFKEVTEVLAFEPDAEVYKYAEKHVNAYGHRDGLPLRLKNKIKLFRKAVGKAYLAEGQSGNHSAAPTVSLNDIIPLHAKRIAIKCDTEGAEYDTFTPDADLSKVYAVQIEFHEGPRIFRKC